MSRNITLHVAKHRFPYDVEEDMKNFVRQDRQRASMIRTLDADWPQALKTRLILGEFLSSFLHESGRPVIYVCIDMAVTNYMRYLGVKPDSYRYSEFLNSLLLEMSSRLEGVKISYGPRPHETWSAVSHQSFPHWLSAFDRVENGRNLAVVRDEKGPSAQQVYMALLRKASPAMPASSLDMLRANAIGWIESVY